MLRNWNLQTHLPHKDQLTSLSGTWSLKTPQSSWSWSASIMFSVLVTTAVLLHRDITEKWSVLECRDVQDVKQVIVLQDSWRWSNASSGQRGSKEGPQLCLSNLTNLEWNTDLTKNLSPYWGQLKKWMGCECQESVCKTTFRHSTRARVPTDVYNAAGKPKVHNSQTWNAGQAVSVPQHATNAHAHMYTDAIWEMLPEASSSCRWNQIHSLETLV